MSDSRLLKDSIAAKLKEILSNYRSEQKDDFALDKAAHEYQMYQRSLALTYSNNKAAMEQAFKQALDTFSTDDQDVLDDIKNHKFDPNLFVDQEGRYFSGHEEPSIEIIDEQGIDEKIDTAHRDLENFFKDYHAELAMEFANLMIKKLVGDALKSKYHELYEKDLAQVQDGQRSTYPLFETTLSALSENKELNSDQKQLVNTMIMIDNDYKIVFEKMQAVQTLRDALTLTQGQESVQDKRDKIATFQDKLPDAINILKKHRAPNLDRVINAINVILVPVFGIGIVMALARAINSKIQYGSFNFTKTKGEIVVDRAEEKIKEAGIKSLREKKR